MELTRRRLLRAASVGIATSVAASWRWGLRSAEGQEAKDAAPATPLPIGAGQAPADRWPCFRGSLWMTGVSASALRTPLQQAWLHESKQPIEATAAIAGGVVFLPTLDATVLALDLETGKPVWTFTSPDQGVGSKSSPCVGEKAVYYGDEQGTVRALDRKTGALLWTAKTEGEIISSPTLIGERILVGSYDESLYCFNATTGETTWKLQTEGPVHCSPTLIGDQVAVAGCDGFLRLVSIEGGKVSRSLEIGGNIASTPAVEGKMLYLGTMSNQVLGINWETMQRAWTFEHPKRRFPYASSAAIAGDLVLIGGRDKLLHAFDKATGEERWTYAARGRVDSSPVIAGSVAFFGSNDGNLYAVDAKSGQTRWEYQAGSGILSSPAVASGKLCIATQEGSIYCFAGRKGT